MEMWAMLGFGVGLGILHAAIPSHWMPLAALARGLRWPIGKLVRTTVAIGFAHIASTIAFGVLIGALVVEAQARATIARYEEVGQWTATGIVVALGLVFIARDLIGRKHDHANCCGDPLHTHAAIHLHDARALAATQPASSPAPSVPGIDRMSIASIFLAMLASPCLLLVPHYVEAGRLGWAGIAALSAVYLAVTLPVMVGLVVLAHAGIGRLRWGLLDRHERALCGALLVIAAIAGRALHELAHDHDGHAPGEHSHSAHEHEGNAPDHDGSGGSGSEHDAHHDHDHDSHR